MVNKVFFGHGRLEAHNGQSVIRMENDGLFQDGADSVLRVDVETKRLVSEDLDFESQILYADGDIYWHILNTTNEAKKLAWRGRLRAKSSQKLRGLRAIETKCESLHGSLKMLLRPPGFRADFTLDCRHIPYGLCLPEIQAYYDCIIRRWNSPTLDNRVLALMDKDTVEAIQGLCPLWSRHDAKTIEDLMEDDSIFGQISEPSERDVVLDHLLHQPRILSFRTFRTDCYLLEACARSLMKAVFPTQTRSLCLRDALREIYIGNCFEWSYLNLWLSAMRRLPRPRALNTTWMDFRSYLRSQAQAFGFRQRKRSAVGQGPAESSPLELNEKAQAVALSTDDSASAASRDKRRPLTSMETFYQSQKFFTVGYLARSMQCDGANIVMRKFATPLAVLYDLVDCFGLVPDHLVPWSTEKARPQVAPEHVEATEISSQQLDGVREALAPSSCYTRSSCTPSSPNREILYHQSDGFHDEASYGAEYALTIGSPAEQLAEDASSPPPDLTRGTRIESDGVYQEFSTGTEHIQGRSSAAQLSPREEHSTEGLASTEANYNPRETLTFNAAELGPALPASDFPPDERRAPVAQQLRSTDGVASCTSVPFPWHRKRNAGIFSANDIGYNQRTKRVKRS